MLKKNNFFSDDCASGRIRISAFACKMGSDLQVLLSGGDGHIGAIAIAGPDCNNFFSRQGHHEGELALELAKNLSAALDCCVAVSAGIHYNRITSEEISQVVAMTRILCANITAYFKNEA